MPSRRVPREATIWRQLLDWSNRVVQHADPMVHNVNNADLFAYDIDQWTIPVEFAGSMIVFLILASLSRCKPLTRLFITTGIMFWQLNIASFAPFLFIGGMFIADLQLYFSTKDEMRGSYECQVEGAFALRADLNASQDAILPRHLSSSTRSLRCARYVRRLRAAFWVLICMASLYVLSAPEIRLGPMDGKAAPGYQALQSLIPKRYWDIDKPDFFLIPMGAFFLVLSIDNFPPLQHAFTNTFAQYLGRVSFSLYLVHGPLLYTLAIYLAPRAMALTGTKTDLQWSVGAGLVYCIFWPVAIWYADLVCRVLDERTVACLRKLYDRAVCL